MTFQKMYKVVALAVLTCGVTTLASAQNRNQSQADQQRAYYRAWQQYYQQYYSNYVQQPTRAWRSMMQHDRYSTYQTQRPASWYQAPQQNAAYSQPRQQQSAAKAPSSAPTRTAKSDTIDLDSQAPVKKAQAKKSSSKTWYTDYDSAWKAACEQGRPLVLVFVHEGCPECSRMDANLAKPGAMETLACAVKARIEFTDHPATVNRFNIKLTPTFLVIAPDGTEAYREVGALDVARLRQIQPALESLVAASAAPEKADVSYSPAADTSEPVDDKTSQVVAAL